MTEETKQYDDAQKRRRAPTISARNSSVLESSLVRRLQRPGRAKRAAPFGLRLAMP